MTFLKPFKLTNIYFPKATSGGSGVTGPHIIVTFPSCCEYKPVSFFYYHCKNCPQFLIALIRPFSNIKVPVFFSPLGAFTCEDGIVIWQWYEGPTRCWHLYCLSCKELNHSFTSAVDCRSHMKSTFPWLVAVKSHFREGQELSQLVESVICEKQSVASKSVDLAVRVLSCNCG